MVFIQEKQELTLDLAARLGLDAVAQLSLGTLEARGSLGWMFEPHKLMGFGVDVSPFPFLGVIFRFQPLVFKGVYPKAYSDSLGLVKQIKEDEHVQIEKK